MQALEKRAVTLSETAGGREPRNKRKLPLAAMLRHPEMLQALGSGVLMLAGWGASHWSHLLSVGLYVAAYGVGGWIKAKEGAITLIKERDLDVNLLMIAAALGAASIGYWNEGAMLIFIFALSGALETFASDQSRKSISSLMALRPEKALRVSGGRMEMVPVGELASEDLVLVRPGEIIPADGVVQSGTSAVNQASITGESIPVDKAVGDQVYAGTLNGENALYIEVSGPADGTLFAKIIALVEEAEEAVPASQRFIEKFEGIYARTVVGATVLLIGLSPLLFGWTWNESFYKAMVFLVVASPCALVASIMPAMLSAISSSAKRGILFKGSVHVQNLAETRIVAFDKTGTLTEGKPVVTDLIVKDGEGENHLLQMAASAEQLSAHPLAKAVVAEAARRGLELQPIAEMKSVAGWGVEAVIRGETWKIGKADFASDTCADQEWWIEQSDELEQAGKTVSIILREGVPVGLLALRDEVRPVAKAAISHLHKLGIKAAMLTGDNEATAKAIASEAGIDLVLSGLLPQDKASRIQQLREQYGGVVMVGDGVNDAPALAAANVGIGMGAGSGAALDAADVVLMNDDIDRIAGAISLARRSRRIVKQNIVFAIAVISLLVAGNFGIGIPLPLGVVGHEGSTILVILNGLRLLRYGPSPS
ncbi:heavy metal translocating P-type ATPase [Paenibacillus physcomitrellae]|uniref:ATPase n=1 Tax=Paenibacillus physcomitrellae TaxID=1619311 RepID=A0ABQ1GUH7_9BACL|nr:heavy metal translocating P-type ATPase [Paenibacillus physcomitrellae]GGA50370.1 ATPase [Paenibacillus physcomitrellae]